MRPTTAIQLAMLFLAGSTAQAQAPDPNGESFVDVDNHPFGPGDREMSARVKLLPGETSASTEVWVQYGEDRGVLLGAHLESPLPRGRCRLTSVGADGVMTLTFVFPHADHPRPNAEDRNPLSVRSGRVTHYKLIKKRGAVQVASAIVSFTMPDKLTVANFGDSYASGEGAPYAASSENRWDDELCHRSGNSGQARAVKVYKQEHPETAIAFRNVACSGAAVLDGVVNSQDKRGPFQDETMSERVPPQVQQVEQWLRSNAYAELNVALISVGGNDIGFGPYVKEYLVLPSNLMDREHRQARINVKTNIDEDIPVVYETLKSTFDAHFDYDRVLVTQYPDPTHWRDGSYCGDKGPLEYGSCWGLVEMTSSAAEYEFAHDSILARLNSRIQARVETFPGWRFLAGTAQRSKNHGICNCSEPYVNTLGASLLEQGDPFGTMHLNRTATSQVYRPIVLEGLAVAIRSIRLQYARERAKEIAREKALAASRRQSLRATLLTRPRPVLRGTPLRSAAIPPALLEKARGEARRLPPVAPADDNRMPQSDQE